MMVCWSDLTSQVPHGRSPSHRIFLSLQETQAPRRRLIFFIIAYSTVVLPLEDYYIAFKRDTVNSATSILHCRYHDIIQETKMKQVQYRDSHVSQKLQLV